MALLNFDIKEKVFPLNGSFHSILADIHFTAEPGEFISIIGPSGSGKTTMLKILLGLDMDYKGRVSIEGVPVTGPGLDRGVVFQDQRLFPWLTVEENISFALPNVKLKDERVTDIIARVGLAEHSKTYPKHLSGGMAQRVALARALVNVPKLLLLDEAFGSLDDFTRQKMQNELLQMLAGSRTTTIMVSHSIDEVVLLSDKIIVLGGKPASITEIINVDMIRPRNKKSEIFNQYRNKLIQEL